MCFYQRYTGLAEMAKVYTNLFGHVYMYLSSKMFDVGWLFSQTGLA